MIKIAILDDDIIQRQLIEKMVEEYFETNVSNAYEIRVFNSANKLINAIYEYGSFDIYLLDVVMPETNGIEVGKQLRNMNEKGFIVYLSLEPGYSLDAFSVRAYHYLVKPIQKDQLFELLKEIYEQLKINHSNHIFVKTKDSIEQIDLDDINYIELLKRRVHYYLSNQTTIISTTLHETFENAMKDVLKDNRFMMCGVSYVVNLHQIVSIRELQIIFKNSDISNPPRKYISAIKSQWLEYWLKDS